MLTPLLIASAMGLVLAQAEAAPARDVPMPPPPPGMVKRDVPMPPPPPGMAKKEAAAAEPKKAEAPKPQPVKLAALELSGLNLDQKAMSFYSEHVAQQLSFQGLRVTTSKEISTLLGFERQKQLLACDEEATSCVAELANALGVDCILTGDIGKFGTKYQITLKILSASDARVLAAYSARVNGDEALLDELSRAARAMAPEIGRKLGRVLVATKHAATLEPEAKPLKIPWGWVALGTGAVLAGGGGYSMSLAAARYDQLRNPTGQVSTATATQLHQQGVLFQSAGWVAIGVGAAAVAGGAALLILEPREAPAEAPAAVLLPTTDGGFVFSFSGGF